MKKKLAFAIAALLPALASAAGPTPCVVDMRGVSVAGPQASFQLDLQTAPVSEPASAALLLGGMALLATRRRA